MSVPALKGQRQLFADLRIEARKRHTPFGAAMDIPVIHIGTATCGIAAGALETKASFEQVLAERGVVARIHEVGCIGHCYAEPLVVIENPGFLPICYQKVTPGIARMLVKAYLEKGDPRLIHSIGAMTAAKNMASVFDRPRFEREKRLVMERCGKIDPTDIYDYINSGGYAAWQKALTMGPDAIIAEIAAAGLRGRGGAGYLAAKKWDLAGKNSHGQGIVICNADEGDPGAYMDRTLLESNPHQIVEGVAICALATGASEAVIYIRAEYPRAVSMVSKAIQQARQCGLLGPNILGTSRALQMEIFQGSGAFVCGEETALIQSIRGRRGTPRHRPPYPAQKGLWGRATVINNAKTLAAVPWIIENGARQFRTRGTRHSPGTAIFSVVGDVRYPGLIEIPTGVYLDNLIFDICGGVPGKKPFKAVQIGGPSGGCLPREFLTTPIDFDALTEAGAMMGSGGMVVMNEDTCMVDVARFFMGFIRNESCGKCTFCRIGTYQLQVILKRITLGLGRLDDLALLESLSLDVKAGSLCALGKTAPNPVLTSLTYFRSEYEAHIHEKRCPACMCRELTAFYIDGKRCSKGCDACRGSCPVEAIFTGPDKKKNIDQDLCVKCGECLVVCPEGFGAVKKISPAHLAPRRTKPKGRYRAPSQK